MGSIQNLPTSAPGIDADMQAASDISVHVIVRQEENSTTLLLSSERRVSTAWTVEQLKKKLVPITGIPPSSQNLCTSDLSGARIMIGDDQSLLADRRYGLKRDSVIEVGNESWRLQIMPHDIDACLLDRPCK